MAIYGIGAFYNEDVSEEFINNNLIGTGWNNNDAPEIHELIRSLKVGDIVYIKALPRGSSVINIKGIGVIVNNQLLSTIDNELTEIGRNMRWLNTSKFSIQKPFEKNNVRSNTIYEEYHPMIQQEILNRI